MPQATWNGAVIADSDQTIVVEGNHYFPVAALRQEYVQPSEKHTVCGWKGTASYYDLVVDGQTNAAAVWYYPDPKPEAQEIRDHVAFWKGVQVEE
ncbi:DUF427 domain-containing protein [Lignipirellula cremea]|uniref:DUF427 domain-containing protein n=1 Tax=Lignipirellula cremea TaxID=2528010 RepID=A0A518E1Y7_9BACT|nr:DUF427 domain-containing protein [Lignipirellula cremea]QDU98106.1 hypothetical protein Pla8534_59670 [Lignipirellula cremea]